MIKIVKFSRPTVICEYCKATLEYEYIDIQDRQIRMNEYERYIVCPICSHDVDVD